MIRGRRSSVGAGASFAEDEARGGAAPRGAPGTRGVAEPFANGTTGSSVRTAELGAFIARMRSAVGGAMWRIVRATTSTRCGVW